MAVVATAFNAEVLARLPEEPNISSLVALKLAYKRNRGGESRGQQQVDSADSWRIRGIEGVETMKPVLDGRLEMSGNLVLVPVQRSFVDGFTGKGELDVWVVMQIIHG